MNRIILIGNGFDLAHGLKTGYRDFMCNYWREFAQKYPETHGGVPYEDDFIKLENTNGPQGGVDAWAGAMYAGDAKCRAFRSFIKEVSEITSYNDLMRLITEAKETASLIYNLTFKNSFWEHLAKASALNTWLDIENEYYLLLKGYLSKSDRSEQVEKLNKEFGEVKNLLEKYLIGICRNYLPQVEPNQGIMEHLFIRNGIERRCVALSKQAAFEDCVPEQKKELMKMAREHMRINRERAERAQIQKSARGMSYLYQHSREKTEEELEREAEQCIETWGIDPKQTLLLNFNYTPTFEKLYGNCGELKIINIHGELRSAANPMIFGYGDEMDVDYQDIERTNDNDMLNNMKHIHYMNTANYRQFLEFLQLDSYQVFIMGHSCGNSDRTLLNTLFEHPNCASIMPFYYQWADDDVKKAGDDYIEIYKNTSRNFTDKRRMRDIVVNKTYCKPHPQNRPSDMVD